MSDIHLKPVESSNVESVGYDEPSRTLRVKFKSGEIYDYAGVPADLHQRVMNADSIGSVIHRHIKRHHAATKVPR